ncbi:MAG: hypothetical protein U0401_19085 [Anaerolineae bacterium]
MPERKDPGQTDKIDAQVIARFGATMKPQARARREQALKSG